MVVTIRKDPPALCRYVLFTFNPSFLVLILWFPGSSDEKKLSPHLRQPTLYSSRKQTHTYTAPTTHISQMHVHIPPGICTHLYTCIHTHIQTHTHTHTCTYPSYAYAHTPNMYHTLCSPSQSSTDLAVSIILIMPGNAGTSIPCAHGRDHEDKTQLDSKLLRKKGALGSVSEGGPLP